MRRSLGNESLEESLCILGVPYIRAGAEPEGYNLSYSISLKKFFVSSYIENVVVKLQGWVFTELFELRSV